MQQDLTKSYINAQQQLPINRVKFAAIPILDDTNNLIKKEIQNDSVIQTENGLITHLITLNLNKVNNQYTMQCYDNQQNIVQINGAKSILQYNNFDLFLLKIQSILNKHIENQIASSVSNGIAKIFNYSSNNESSDILKTINDINIGANSEGHYCFYMKLSGKTTQNDIEKIFQCTEQQNDLAQCMTQSVIY